MCKLRKLAVSCIFILLAIGLFLTCDDPSNPFSNNLGEKVVVEPPTIEDISPVSGSYLQGTVPFTANAKAYIKVEKVEVYIYPNEENGQKEIKWTDKGIVLTGGLKQKTMKYDFNTLNYNTGADGIPKDGPIRMKFRIFDSTNKPIESIELIYIIKNNPSVIKMAYPSDADVFKSSEPANVSWGGDIRGSITDRRGLRPGFPQIKLWPENDPEPGDEGWASLFLTGYDNMEKEGNDPTLSPAGHGWYDDRSKKRVVNAASFSLRLAEYTIVPDPDYPDNPDLRRVHYTVTDGKHVLFSPNRIFKFKIRTRDVEPDPFKGSIPSVDPDPIDPQKLPWIEGFYPPRDFLTPNENTFYIRGDYDEETGNIISEEPAKIRVFNADMRPTVEINNDDIDNATLNSRPNIYITSSNSTKIVQGGFRLRLFALFEKGDGTPVWAKLSYEHSSTVKRAGDLDWDSAAPGSGGNAIAGTSYVSNGRNGTLFTFTAQPGSTIFTDSSEAYTLLFKVKVEGLEEKDWPVYSYTVKMDGKFPDVSIRSVQGASNDKPPEGSGATYTVNGNIQAVVDRTDGSGIMPYRENNNLGMSPPDSDDYPMVKWIVETADNSHTSPADTGSVLALLKTYQTAPTSENLGFFRDITDTQASSLTGLPSGWVRIPVSGTNIDADKNDHFKLNTTVLNMDKGYLWVYVIAMDQAYNLGYTVRKIYIDQSTDYPRPDTKKLFEKNAGGQDIADEKNLDVTVTITNNGTLVTREMTGNYSGSVTDGKRNNVLGRNDDISLNFIDDDGISLDKGGVAITLTVIDPVSDVEQNKRSVTLTKEKIMEALNEIENSESKRDLSGILRQEAMAQLFYGEDYEGGLKDGMYKIEITVKDDIDQKIKITDRDRNPPLTLAGDTPEVAEKTVVYYFAVATDKPVIDIIHPDNNALGSSEPLDVYGTVKSRLNVQSALITFTPNVISPSTNQNTSGPVSLTLWANAAYSTPGAQAVPDDEGYYTYYWIQKAVVFHPMQNGGGAWFGDEYNGLRSFNVEAYDRLGYVSEEVRTVQVDSSEPDITLIEFNYNRPADSKDGKLYLYGKVSFTVTASDTNGMSEITVDGVPMSGIKWWVLPATADKPSWGTPFQSYTNAALTPNTWRGGSNFTVAQTRDGGKFVGVVDTRYLADKPTEYKFYYMAMDKAGNTKIDSVILQPAIDVFTVDQSRDYPFIYKNTLSPQPDDVINKEKVINSGISGTIGDADLFNPGKLATARYVEIRYPASMNNGVPVWTNWIPITIPATYSSKDGGIDPAGDIVFKFYPADPVTGNAGANTYFSSDGMKYYQIRVTDEPVGPTDAEKADGAKWYGKNPDEFMRADTAAYPGYNAVYLLHDKVSRIFPLDTKTTAEPEEAYTFVVDNTKPEIFFNLYDPTVGHENYLAARPTFSKWTQLKEALSNNPKNKKGNYVKEDLLIDLVMTWSAGNDIFTKVILNNPPNPALAAGGVAGEYPWALASPGFTAEDNTNLETIFNHAPQGLQVITFEATDKVPLTGRVSWIFAKDNQGPEINFGNISRSIKRKPATGESATEFFPGVPAANNFPDESASGARKGPLWPSDWRYGTTWKTAWDVTWTNFITYWPSEYAFKAAAEVIIALNTENDREPSTVIGDDNTIPYLEGTFSDEYSSVRKLVPANTPTYFYYRFKYKTGALQPIPATLAAGITKVTIDGSDWIQKEIEAAKEKQTEKEADWKIILNPANGFTGTDGENWVDIRIADTAENISEIYNVRFLVDRAPPLLGNYDAYVIPPATPNTINKGEFRISKLKGVDQAHPNLVLPEDQRVISAAGADNGTGNVFTVTGRVNDYNLRNLRISLGQDGTTAYTVEASVVIDPIALTVSYTDDKLANDVIDTNVKRLKLTGPYVAGTTNTYNSTSTGTPEWEWTFDILQKDAYGLREAAKTIGGVADSGLTDSNRRYIRVTASDKAGKREGPVEWAFYLDTKKPVIEYTNLEKGIGLSCSSFESDVKLSGLVSDDTKIKDVLFIIGRWNYATNVWNWYSGTDWTVTTQPTTDLTKWTSAFTNATTPARQTTMEWTIDQAKLTAAGPGKYPANLFNTEGQYRIDLYVTDFSLGDGNPNNTMLSTDTTFSDLAPPGQISGRVFYIDKKDPTLKWASTIEDKTYFRNEDSGTDQGKAIFGFIAGDGNTLKSWTVVVTDNSTGQPVQTTGGAIKWDVGTSKTSLAIAVPSTVNSNLTTPATVGGKLISITSVDDQYFEVKPFMTKTANSTGDPLDKDLKDSNGNPILPTYTITITVTDGANRTSSITKQFTLDNTPPEFVKQNYRPLSYKWGDANKPANADIISTNPQVERSYSYDAVTGKLTIRGNTTDNSNQIKSISYYVVNSTDTPGFTSFPTTKWVTDNNKWRSTADKNTEIQTSGATPTTLIQLDEGTLFAWSVLAPQTSLFLTDDTVAKTYVQNTKPGGVPITGGASVSAGTYNDVDITTNPWSTTSRSVPTLTFPDLNNPFNSVNPKAIYGGDPVGLITVYVRAEDAAGNVAYDALKYWIWPEGDRPIVTAINNPDSSKIEIERLLNGTIRLSGMAKDNERVKYVWFRVLDPNGVPYGTGTLKPIIIPVWQDSKIENGKTVGIGGNWEEATPKANQTAVDGSTLGARRDGDSIAAPGAGGSTGGWYMANGGHSRDVSWWAYINTNGELDPTGTEESKKFTVEVRAQDVTYDEKNDKWMDYVTNGYRGMASAMTAVSRVDAWVVAGAPIFEKAFVAPTDSKSAEAAESTTAKIWESIDTLNMRGRSAYKVTVKHNSGLSSIRWSPTFWDKSLTSGGITGAFQANPKLDSVNLLELPDTNSADPDCVYVYRTGTEAYAMSSTTAPVKQSAAFTSMNASGTANTIPRMILTVKPKNMKGPGSVSLLANKRYMIWKWDIALENSNAFPHTVSAGVCNDPTHWANGVHKDMKNSVFTPAAGTYNIGNAILIESELEGTVNYFKWDVFVDVRADLLLADMIADDSAYGNGTSARAGQVKNSVRYPVYLSASEVSKATPLTSRGDTLLPIDNLEPYGMYTLNRKPAGTAVTIGGEAGDLGPVNGIARVVLWFQRGASGVSWHEVGKGSGVGQAPEASLAAGTFATYTANSGPAWWDAVGVPGGTVIPALNGTVAVVKPAIPAVNVANAANGVGASAIVIDTNSPSTGQERWGHKLPMGFADGGLGKLWYVEINSYGIQSGPIDLHYVIIDKAGNAKYYKERLIIMNNVAVIDRVKLATDIRSTSWTGTNLASNNGMASNNKINDKDTALTPAQWPVLKDIRTKVPLGGDSTDIKDDVKKGISDWISFSALGPDKVIDFNVRNNLFALRVETTRGAVGKSRNFRLEYISGARLMSDTGATGQKLTDIQAGRMYIINERGTARWGTFGADGDDWKRGYAFIATVSGSELDQTTKDNIGTGSAWEINNGYPAIGERGTGASGVPTALQIADAKYAATAAANAESAEFVYSNAAFGTAATTIVDTNGPADVAWPPTGTWNTWTNANYSLFILRVFDGAESDLFGDFMILRIRVNNDDKTLPFAQLYDLNPKTEGQERSNIAQTNNQDDLVKEERRSVSPMSIGEGTSSNRTKGGLWNSAAKLGDVDKPGHIEPRRVTTYTTTQEPYRTQQHSLSSAQMGGAATSGEASITKPFVNTAGLFTTDTVSGKVVLRGYAEDDQRVHRVRLVIGGENIDILDYPTGGTAAGNAADSANYISPKTGMLSIPTAQNGKVYYTDSIDLYRHRVEWAYIWDTETIPANTMVGNDISVRVISYPRNGATGTAPKTTGSDTIAAPGAAHVATPNQTNWEATRPNTSPYNKDFPVGLNKYNSISVNLRPYITGFLRNKTNFSHDTRSRQGRYMFAQNETAVVKGFNLGGVGNTTPTISINGNSTNTSNVGTIGDYGITQASNSHYRQFTVGTVATGNGLVTYSFNQPAVNTGGGRASGGTPIRPTYIQPWNIEYSPGVDGSTLWDDFTQVHIWRSNDSTSNADQGRFPRDANMEIFDPAMSINHKTGDLWESHNEGGGNGNNSGSTKVSNNNGAASFAVAAFIDPITNSDIYISEQNSGSNGTSNAFTVWSVSSIIGKPGGGQEWRYFGGIWINGPQGGSVNHQSGFNVTGNQGFDGTNDVAARSQYYGESTFYNAYPTNNPTTPASGPTLNQFKNPHIITDFRNNNENIHVSYYDTKDKSVKYRYNRRNAAGTITGTGNNGASTGLTNVPRGWTNLDGGQDAEDQNAASNATTFIDIATGNSNRIVGGTRSTDAGEHNSIAVTSNGYPVVAYYDQANQKLKMAISNSVTPIAGSAWTIVQNVIPTSSQAAYGTGQYVSMRIDTRVTPNVVHIAAMNSLNKTLVYVKGTITGSTYANTSVQVVDSVGSVGRWCALSLDSDGNPWISYQDESYQGARDGIKLAYYNATTYYKGSATYRNGEDVDMNNISVTGWEAMHVPTQFRVENARSGMECYPTRNFTGTRTVADKFWTGAVGYLGESYYRAAYYVK